MSIARWRYGRRAGTGGWRRFGLCTGNGGGRTDRCAKPSTIALQPREIAARFIRIDKLKRRSAVELRRNFHWCHLAQQTDELPIGERIARERLRSSAYHQVRDVAIGQAHSLGPI